MNQNICIAAVCLSVLAAASVCQAKDEWKKVATLTAVGAPKEVAVNRTASRCRIECTDGSVIVNTVVVRQNEQKTGHTVGQRIEKDKSVEFSIGDRIAVTGLRISDDGGGTYVVSLK